MTEKRKSESIIQPDLRSYSPVSCKDFGKLSDKEKAKIVEVIHWELQQNNESGILALALDKLGLVGDLLCPARPMDEVEKLKKNWARLNRLNSVASWSDYTQTKWMIIEYAQELAAIEQEKDRECRNYVLSGWLADKLATLIKNELIEELEDLEI